MYPPNPALNIEGPIACPEPHPRSMTTGSAEMQQSRGKLLGLTSFSTRLIWVVVKIRVPFGVP